MAANALHYVFNRGLVSRLAQARLDIPRFAISSDVHSNFIPRALGSMMLRPGLEYIGATDSNNAVRSLPFIFSNTDHAIIELSATKLRVWDDDALITRPSVSSSVTNGAFTSNLTSWTDNDESGAASAWATGGYMGLTGSETTRAIREQQITVSGGDQNTEHALNIVIERGPVILKVGSSSGDDDYVIQTTLETGYHSFAFTPTGNFYIEFSSFELYQCLVDSVAVASSGAMSLTTPWAADDLGLIRHEQSADIIYVACAGYRQQKIIRWGTKSWSIVDYTPKDGPYRNINVTPITLTSNATTGTATITASEAYFESTHVGSLFKMIALQQSRTASITAQNSFTDSIKVTGVGGERDISIIITGTWNATLTLQYSIGEEGTWVDYGEATANESTVFNDGLDNQIIYYRAGVKTGDFTSGTVGITLNYSRGTQVGHVQVTAVASATSATAIVLSELGGTSATEYWHEGVWNDFRGWPSAVSLHDGRLWWEGRKYLAGSVSDDYESYDTEIEGDSAPVIRSIGFGTIDDINWLHSLDHLLIGTDIRELYARSSGDEEPITATNFNIKKGTSQGSNQVEAVEIDSSLLYVQKTKTRLYSLSYDGARYSSVDMTGHIPEVGEPSIVRMAVQRQPDTRVHCVRGDGKVALMMVDDIEDLICWIIVETDGEIEDVIVLPGLKEDRVYYVVKRTIDGSPVRYYEKWALENECRGGSYLYEGVTTTSITGLDNYPDGITVTVYDSDGDKVEDLVVDNGTVTLSTTSTYALLVPTVHLHADSFLLYDSTETSTISGLDHLEGETVYVRGNGKNLGTYTVTSGSITLSEAVEKAVIGLTYTAKWRSTKMAFSDIKEGVIGKTKGISSAGFILADTKQKGLTYGPTFDDLDPMPETVEGATVDNDYIWEDYDVDVTGIIQKHGNDVRLCLQAAAPDPCTVMATRIEIG